MDDVCTVCDGFQRHILEMDLSESTLGKWHDPFICYWCKNKCKEFYSDMKVFSHEVLIMLLQKVGEILLGIGMDS